MTAERPKMPDIIASTQANIGGLNEDDDLMNLVGAAKRVAVKKVQTEAMPSGYHPQISESEPAVRHKKPARSEKRSLVVNMRLTANERERFYSFCEERNLSLPDGLIELMRLAGH